MKVQDIVLNCWDLGGGVAYYALCTLQAIMYYVQCIFHWLHHTLCMVWWLAVSSIVSFRKCVSSCYLVTVKSGKCCAHRQGMLTNLVCKELSCVSPFFTVIFCINFTYLCCTYLLPYILYLTALFLSVPYCTVLHCTLLFSTFLLCTTLHWTVWWVN